MAAVAKSTQGPVLISPAGSEYVLRGRAGANIANGQPVIITGVSADPRWDCVVGPAAGAEVVIHGVSLGDYESGETAEFATIAEIDGFSGMTGGARLSVTGGLIATDAPPAGATYLCFAINASRIYFRA